MMDPTRVRVRLFQETMTVHFPQRMREAHGTGLNGKTRVNSLAHGEPKEFPGTLVVQDTHGNAIFATPDELLALLRKVAPRYDISARKKRGRRWRPLA